MVDHVMRKMSAHTAQGRGGIQSSSPSTWNECSTHGERETNVGIVPPVDILKDTGRRVRLQESQAAGAAAHTGRCGHHPRLGANYPTHFCLSWTVKGGSPRAVVRDGSKERLDVILMTTPPVRAGGAKKQQGHGVYKPSSPRGTSSVATQSHWATCPHSKPTL